MPGISAFGTQLKRNMGGSPVTYTAVANVTSVGGPSLEAEQIDVTSHDSASGFEEFVAGIKRGGEVEIEGNFDPGNATHESLLDDFDSGDVEEYQLIFPTSPTVTWTFDAVVTAFAPEAPYDDKLAFSATLKLTGPVTRP